MCEIPFEPNARKDRARERMKPSFRNSFRPRDDTYHSCHVCELAGALNVVIDVVDYAVPSCFAFPFCRCTRRRRGGEVSERAGAKPLFFGVLPRTRMGDILAEAEFFVRLSRSISSKSIPLTISVLSSGELRTTERPFVDRLARRALNSPETSMRLAILARVIRLRTTLARRWKYWVGN